MLHLPRLVAFVTFLAMTVGLGLYVNVRALAPRRFATRRAQVRLALASLAAVAAVAAIEILARRHAPFGGGLWRPFVWAERVAGFALMISMLAIVAIDVAARLLFALRARSAAPTGPEALPAPEAPPSP